MKVTPKQIVIFAFAWCFLLAFGGFYILSLLAYHPVSQWAGIRPTEVTKITLVPRLGYSHQTLDAEISVTNASEFSAWFDAINLGRDDWQGANRDRGPRSLRLKFEMNTGSNVVFDVWMCDYYGISSCQELYIGDADIIAPFTIRYSKELRLLIESQLAHHTSQWVSADKRKWNESGMRYMDP